MNKENKDIIHEIQMETAIHIIEEVIEPLFCTMATNIREHPKKTRKQIVSALFDGLNDDIYYDTEDKIIALLVKYNKNI